MATAWATSCYTDPAGFPCPRKNGTSPNYRHIYDPGSAAQNKRQLVDQVQNLCSGEESSAMLYEKKKFEGAIERFLSVTPHHAKFSCPVSLELFQDGVLSPEYTPKPFMAAWEHLSRYAMNLLSRPWRTEYRSLKLYSGFYKHFVEPYLPEAYRIFELMGYSRFLGGLPSELRLLGPIDPDAVILSYLDCAIAAVECDMMTRIMAQLRDVDASWADILATRERYTCGVEDAVNIIRRTLWEREKEAETKRREEALSLGRTPVNPEAASRSLAVQPAFYQGTMFRNPGFSFEETPLVEISSPELPRREVKPSSPPKPPPKPERKSHDVIRAFRSLKLTDHIKGRDLNVVDSGMKKPAQQKHKTQWSCRACTYLNEPDAQICAICAKSCHRGAEERPLMVGGKECLSCTYVNDRNVDVCTVCGESLINCPTYT